MGLDECQLNGMVKLKNVYLWEISSHPLIIEIIGLL